MRADTHWVIARARSRSGDVTELWRGASWSLIQYFALSRGWPPGRIGWTDESARAWWDAAAETMFNEVQKAWHRDGIRGHIRELAVLNELAWERYPDNEDDQQRRDLITGIGNDLGLWKAWPGLHDIRKLLPIAESVMKDPRRSPDQNFAPDRRPPTTRMAKPQLPEL